MKTSKTAHNTTAATCQNGGKEQRDGVSANGKYEPLAIEITQNGGHCYRQVGRNDDTAVYEQLGHYGQLLGYEVIRIKKQDACRMFGKDYPAKELYPSSEDWGSLAFTVNTLKRANEVAKGLSKGSWKGISTPLVASGKAISSQSRGKVAKQPKTAICDKSIVETAICDDCGILFPTSELTEVPMDES